MGFFKESIGFIKLPEKSVVPEKKKKLTSKGSSELWAKLHVDCPAVDQWWEQMWEHSLFLPPLPALPVCDCPTLLTQERKWAWECASVPLQGSPGLSVCDLASITENGV